MFMLALKVCWSVAEKCVGLSPQSVSPRTQDQFHKNTSRPALRSIEFYLDVHDNLPSARVPDMCVVCACVCVCVYLCLCVCVCVCVCVSACVCVNHICKGARWSELRKGVRWCQIYL